MAAADLWTQLPRGGPAMYLDFTAEQQALRREIRDYYRDLLTPEARTALAEDETDE